MEILYMFLRPTRQRNSSGFGGEGDMRELYLFPKEHKILC